jgi:hypothetical protein
MIKYIKITTTLKPNNLQPLPFIGSTLRGAFGHSLKKVTCINPSYECQGCFAKDSCLYYDFYEKQNIAHKYRFDFELDQKNYDFSLYLFEEATQKLPYIISAIHKMLTEQGLGKNREKLDIESIKCNDQEIYYQGEFDLSNINPIEFNPTPTPKNSSTLKFVTPFRTKFQNRLLRQKPELKIVLNSIHNRLNELKNLDRSKLDHEIVYKETDHQINFYDTTRFSNRQKSKLQIGGVLGYINYTQIDIDSLRLLKIGEIIGIGKQTVFGLGKIKIL